MATIFKMNASIKRMFKTMGFSILAIHLSTCFYYLVAKMDAYDYGTSWIQKAKIENITTFEQYIVAMDWSI